jgi:acetylornithine/N-succinyldiaminopimelate aminotransferase
MTETQPGVLEPPVSASAAGPAPELETAPLREGDYLLPVYPHMGFEPVSGDGVVLRTRDGRELVDFYGGHAVALLGYRHPRLLAALAAQAETLFFQSNVVPLEVRARAARALTRFAPAGLDWAFLVNSGAEANENALRLALRFTGRDRVVALEGSFHGRTGASAAVTWKAAETWYGFPRTPFDVTFVPRGDTKALEAALQDKTAAALILEPVQGMGGAIDLGAEYLAAARDLTRKAGALLIFDEVQCGMGRTGQPFAAQLHGVTPDFLTTAKGLAGGFPAGALLTTGAIAARLKLGDLGTTFGGGPLACALIEAVLGAIEDEGLLARVRTLSARLQTGCRVGPVTDVQGAGFLLGLRTSRPAKEVQAELLGRGFVVGTSADPHVVRLLPPLVLTAVHVESFIAALAEIRP